MLHSSDNPQNLREIKDWKMLTASDLVSINGLVSVREVWEDDNVLVKLLLYDLNFRLLP